MFYLCLTFSVLWLAVFGYLMTIDSKLKDVARRLQARNTSV